MTRLESLFYTTLFALISVILLTMHDDRGVIVIAGGVSGAAACWACWHLVFNGWRE